MIDMATTDERVDKLETRFLTLEQRVSAVTAKIDTFIGEMRDFKSEMRDRDNQRVADIKALDAKIDRLGDKIQNMVIAAVVGFGAIVFAAVSILK